jgi:hypothetical protein
MSNHFHVLVRVRAMGNISDEELLRRYSLLYPKPTKYQEASIRVMRSALVAGGEEADKIRMRLKARMHDVSEFMKTLKQRFSTWFNQSHGRYGTLWADRFKSVLVEGAGNPLQTMATYIDLNPVRAGIVSDPKDYRFCGYAEALAGSKGAAKGLAAVWAAYADGSSRGSLDLEVAQGLHREAMFGIRAADSGLSPEEREQAIKVLSKGDGMLAKPVVLRCRIRYFTDGVILGSAEYVRSFLEFADKDRKKPPKPKALPGTDWQELTVLRRLRGPAFE